MQFRFVSLIALSLVLHVRLGSGAGTWTAWGTTTSTCESCPVGTVSFGATRVCVPDAPGATCAGERIMTTVCQTTTGPITTTMAGTTTSVCDQWGEWGAYGTCSMDCGNCGRRSRTRTCDSLAACPSVPCTGNSTEEDPTPCGGNAVCTSQGGTTVPNCCGGTAPYLDRVAKTYTCQ